MHFHADAGWDATLKEAIANLSKLIKDFAKMLSNFVASWKKVPAAATEPASVEDPYGA